MNKNTIIAAVLILGLILFIILTSKKFISSDNVGSGTGRCSNSNLQDYIQDRNLDLHQQYRSDNSHENFSLSSVQIWEEAERQIREEWKCPAKN
jgi:hypothetical protein